MAMETYTFEWFGGHPALDFVNTLDERLSDAPIDRLKSYDALVSFVFQAKLVDEQTARDLWISSQTAEASNVLESTMQFRESLFSTFYSIHTKSVVQPEILEVLTCFIHDSATKRKLTMHESIVTEEWVHPLSVERPLLELIQSAQGLLLSPLHVLIKQCAAEDCGTMFVDDSHARSRRWCSMAGCGNRFKVRESRARQKRKAGRL
jgi:predicted RNA-binding Zn ribbon-like protein